MPDVLDNLLMLIDRGGPLMIVLLVMSVISLALIFERLIFWQAMRRRTTNRRLAALNAALRRGEHDKVRQITQRDRSPFGMVARRLLEAGTNEAVAVEAVEQQRPRLERFMVSLSTIITAAPLIGILGTVIGIIQSFQLIGGTTSVVDTQDVAEGIAVALLTTAFGLIVALVTLFPYMIFRGQVNRAIGRLESLIAAAQHGERHAQSPQGQQLTPNPVSRSQQQRAEPQTTPASPAR